jgi:hypothetical protein
MPDGLTIPVMHTQVMSVAGFISIASMLSARANASSWSHIYTRQYGNFSLVHVYHRRINDLEEGDDNDRLHHVQGRHSSLSSTKKAEDEDQGVFMDYLWNDGSQSDWNLMHGLASESTIGQDIGTGLWVSSC